MKSNVNERIEFQSDNFGRCEQNVLAQNLQQIELSRLKTLCSTLPTPS